MTNRIKGMTTIAMLVAACALAGCAKKPSGQVVAVVNNEEITLQELNAELNELNLPANADKTQARTAILQKIVDRRLLAQSAKEAGIDRDPAFIMQQRRMNEQLLVTMFGQKAMGSIKMPDTTEINKFMAEYPMMFSERTLYRLDQIQFEMPKDFATLNPLENAHSMEAVAAILTEMGLKYKHGNGTFDSGKLPPALMKQVLTLAPGEPFIVPSPDRTQAIVNVITGSEPITIPPEQARQLAAQTLRSQNLTKIGEDRLKEAKATAKIEYQPDYAPAPKKDEKSEKTKKAEEKTS